MNDSKGTDINFKALFESAPGLFLVLLPDLKIAAVSDAYANTTMTKREDILGRGLFDVFPDNPDDKTADGVSNLRASLDFVLKNKTAHTMADQKYDIKRPDGKFEERYWSPLNSPVLNSKNELLYIIHRVEDITQKKLVEARLEEKLLYIKNNEDRMNKILEVLLKYTLIDFSEKAIVSTSGDELDAIAVGLNTLGEELESNIWQLKKSNELFSNLFEHNPAAIVISRLSDAKLTNVNEAFLSYYGFSSKEYVLGKTARELNLVAKPEQREELAEMLKKNKVVKDFEIESYSQEGKVFWVSTSILIIDINNEPCLFSISVDISNRKKAEEQLLSVNKELEAFSYSVSHDLRAPLRAVNGYAQMLNEDYGQQLDQEGKRILETIRYNATKMGKLIDDLLSFSRLGRKEVQKTAVDMNELTEGVLGELSKNVPHNTKIEIGALHKTTADYGLLNQVMFNLISNAVKYSSRKKNPLVQITSEEKVDHIIFSVRDNGAGFDMKYYDKLFGVFQRLHSQDEFEGTGVGLAIIQRIIAKHGGKIWAEGKINEGAVFSFSLPKK